MCWPGCQTLPFLKINNSLVIFFLPLESFLFSSSLCSYYASVNTCFLRLICVTCKKIPVSFFSPVPPSIHEIKSHGIGMGRLPLLRCEAAAVPPPTFEWYKGEKRWARVDCWSCVSWFTLLIGCIKTARARAGGSVAAAMSTRSQR